MAADNKRRTQQLAKQEQRQAQELERIRKNKSRIMQKEGYEPKSGGHFFLLIIIAIVVAVIWFLFFR